MNKTNQKGSSMIEVMGVMAILGMATIGIYAGISNVHKRFRLANGYDEIRRVIKSTREQFASFRPTDVSADKLEKIGIFSNSFTSGGKKYSGSSLGYNMQIKLPGTGDGQYTSTFSDTFRLYLYDVDFQTCVDLLTSDWGSDASSGLAELSTSNSSKAFRWPNNLSGTQHPLPAETETAATECTPANGKSAVTIYWEYYF